MGPYILTRCSFSSAQIRRLYKNTTIPAVFVSEINRQAQKEMKQGDKVKMAWKPLSKTKSDKHHRLLRKEDHDLIKKVFPLPPICSQFKLGAKGGFPGAGYWTRTQPDTFLRTDGFKLRLRKDGWWQFKIPISPGQNQPLIYET